MSADFIDLAFAKSDQGRDLGELKILVIVHCQNFIGRRRKLLNLLNEKRQKRLAFQDFK